MKDSEFTKLLTRCAKSAAKHFELMRQVNEECKSRYGCSYSDIDADSLIDTLDIAGCDTLTSDEFDAAMKFHGAKRQEGE